MTRELLTTTKAVLATTKTICRLLKIILVSKAHHPITTAKINTTLFAVIVAGISAYLVFVNTAIHDAEFRTIQEASKINAINVNFLFTPYGAVDHNDLYDKDKLTETIYSAMLCIDTPVLSSDINARAQKVLGIIKALVIQYPFPEKMKRDNHGHDVYNPIPDTLTFGNLHDVNIWIHAMEKTTWPFVRDWTQTCIKPLLDDFSRSDMVLQYKQSEPRIMSIPRVDTGYYFTLEGLDPVAAFNYYFTRISEARAIMKVTKINMDQANALQKRYPNKAVLVAVFIMLACLVISGIIYPLSSLNVKSIFVVWVPFTIYALLFIYLGYKVILPSP